MEKFQISVKNLSNLWSFKKIYAVFVLNLCGENLCGEKMTNMRTDSTRAIDKLTMFCLSARIVNIVPVVRCGQGGQEVATKWKQVEISAREALHPWSQCSARLSTVYPPYNTWMTPTSYRVILHLPYLPCLAFSLPPAKPMCCVYLPCDTTFLMRP